jgi:hypothetical protein
MDALTKAWTIVAEEDLPEAVAVEQQLEDLIACAEGHDPVALRELADLARLSVPVAFSQRDLGRKLRQHSMQLRVAVAMLQGQL